MFSCPASQQRIASSVLTSSSSRCHHRRCHHRRSNHPAPFTTHSWMVGGGQQQREQKRDGVRENTASMTSTIERRFDDDENNSRRRFKREEEEQKQQQREKRREEEEEDYHVLQFKRRPGRHTEFSAQKEGTIEVLENTSDPSRSLRRYMSLPATSYSTLDAETVKRTDDETFECTLGTLEFLGFKITPTVVANVNVRPNGKGPRISVQEASISGSKMVDDANEQFQLSSINDVSWFDSPTEEHKNQKTIKSKTIVSVYLIVPKWFPFTVKSTERTGRFVVNQVVNQVVPKFLEQLKADYEVWSGGDDSRKAVCEGGLGFDVNEEECEVDY